MNRIIFVDDEQRILDALRDLLRRERKRWDMTFALGGEAGILALGQSSFDVVISDMRMPKVDGGMVLEAAKRLQPRAGRIVLSGQTEPEVATRMVPVAHQFLTKPCDGATLRSVIERVLELNDLVKDPRLQKLVGGTDTLPAAPRIYADLVAALNAPNSCTKDVARVLERDPALSAKLFQLTNSAFFGLKRTVSSIDTAVSLLGVDTIRGLVLALGAFGSITEKTQSPHVASLQEHGVLTGDIARAMAMGHPDKDAVFAGALMHDIGRLLLATRLPDLYEEVEKLRASESISLCEAEQRLFGVTHADVGAYLLSLWGLPPDIIEAVRYHHEPWRATTMSAVVKLVGAAVRLAGPVAGPESEDPPQAHLDDPVCVEAAARWRHVEAERRA